MGSARDFAGLLRMVNGGRWSPVIDSVRPLEEAAAAHERMQAGEHFGKLVLTDEEGLSPKVGPLGGQTLETSSSSGLRSARALHSSAVRRSGWRSRAG